MVSVKIYRNIFTDELLTEGQFRKRSNNYRETLKTKGVKELPTIKEIMLNDDDIMYLGELDVTELIGG